MFTFFTFVLISDVHPGHYGELCTIEVDLYHLYGTSSVQELSSTRDGKKYYRIFYDVVIFFGEPELKVHLVWKERGKERWLVLVFFKRLDFVTKFSPGARLGLSTKTS